MNINSWMAGAALLLLSSAASAANRPAGYVTLCTEGKTCSVASATNVAFGRSGQFFYKVLTGSFLCAESTFGGKVAGGVNECSVPSGTASSSSSSTAASSSSSRSSSSTSSSSSSKTSSSKSSSTSSVSSAPANTCQAGSVITNATVDCGGITVGTSCAGGSESQQPVFTLNNATIKNVHLRAGGAADGIHCVAGNCRLENVVWDDVCEDAATLMDAGVTMTVSGGSANAADDKVFQHNSKNSTIVIENFSTTGRIGKLYRSCGDCTGNGGPRYVNINNVTMNGSTGTIVGVNRNYGDKATIRNLRIKGWVYPDSGGEICMEYNGVEKGSGDSSELGLFWNTASCNVSPTDVTGF